MIKFIDLRKFNGTHVTGAGLSGKAMMMMMMTMMMMMMMIVMMMIRAVRRIIPTRADRGSHWRLFA